MPKIKGSDATKLDRLAAAFEQADADEIKRAVLGYVKFAKTRQEDFEIARTGLAYIAGYIGKSEIILGR